MKYKVFTASYETSGGCGSIQKLSVVVSETSSTALGDLLSMYGDTTAADWDLEEMDPAVRGITHMCECGC